jgi:hypothetical protein
MTNTPSDPRRDFLEQLMNDNLAAAFEFAVELYGCVGCANLALWHRAEQMAHARAMKAERHFLHLTTKRGRRVVIACRACQTKAFSSALIRYTWQDLKDREERRKKLEEYPDEEDRDGDE